MKGEKDSISPFTKDLSTYNVKQINCDLANYKLAFE